MRAPTPQMMSACTSEVELPPCRSVSLGGVPHAPLGELPDGPAVRFAVLTLHLMHLGRRINAQSELRT